MEQLRCEEKHSKESATHVVLLMKVCELTWKDWPTDSHRSDVVHNLSGNTWNFHTSVEIRSSNKSHIGQEITFSEFVEILFPGDYQL